MTRPTTGKALHCGQCRVKNSRGLLETIGILSNKSAVKRIRKSWKEARTGKTVSLPTLRRRLEGASSQD